MKIDDNEMLAVIEEAMDNRICTKDVLLDDLIEYFVMFCEDVDEVEEAIKNNKVFQEWERNIINY